MSIQTHFIAEPLLEFGNCQKLEHPQDGLFLYGPVKSQGSPDVIHIGVVGTPDGIALTKRWLVLCRGRFRSRGLINYTPRRGLDFKRRLACVWHRPLLLQSRSRVATSLRRL